MKFLRISMKFIIPIFLMIGGLTVNIQADELSPGTPPKFPIRNEITTENQISTELQLHTFLPYIIAEAPPTWIDIQDKEIVKQFYLTTYLASEGVDIQWTGNHETCNPGTTADNFRESILTRINYFRSMSGVPVLKGLNDTYNNFAQAAALMMSVNEKLDHNPPDTWTCYSDEGLIGASRSNLYLGFYGPSAISGYMYDPGSNNSAVGHRRWILYPQTQTMGTGDIPPVNGYPPSNALYVFDDNLWETRPATREEFVSWPPPGYIPRQVVYPRWSFSYAQANFYSAAVNVTRNGQTVGVSISPVANGYGENTLVWELEESIPDGDVTYDVMVQNVIIDSVPHNFSYQVKIFDVYD